LPHATNPLPLLQPPPTSIFLFQVASHISVHLDNFRTCPSASSLCASGSWLSGRCSSEFYSGHIPQEPCNANRGSQGVLSVWGPRHGDTLGYMSKCIQAGTCVLPFENGILGI
jgi:hypothetical protein